MVENHLSRVAEHQRSVLSRRLRHSRVFEALDVSLDILQRLATCAAGCRGGSHRLERIAGRSYNVSVGAFALVNLGLYDEARALIRQMVEVVNLLALFTVNPDLYIRWIEVPRSERIRRFSPSAVRRAIEAAETLPLPLEEEWYRELSEDAAHVTPLTVPNAHGRRKRPSIGGEYQQAGRRKTLKELNEVCQWAALILAGWIGSDADLDEVGDLFGAEEEE